MNSMLWLDMTAGPVVFTTVAGSVFARTVAGYRFFLFLGAFALPGGLVAFGVMGLRTATEPVYSRAS